jgi:4-amino-4-deoxy-L-arabinose transferase-like glycosyltransferase
MKRLRRWLFNVLAALSLLLCIVTAAMWTIAKQHQRLWYYHHVEHQAAEIRVQHGIYGWDQYGLIVYSNETDYLYGQTYDRDFHPQGQPTEQDIAQAGKMANDPNVGTLIDPLVGWRFRWAIIGSSVVTTYQRLTLYSRYTRMVVIPYYRLLLLALLLPTAWLVGGVRRSRRQAHRRANNLCLNCGYDLRATPDRCPECGTPVKPSRTQHHETLDHP